MTALSVRGRLRGAGVRCQCGLANRNELLRVGLLVSQQLLCEVERSLVHLACRRHLGEEVGNGQLNSRRGRDGERGGLLGGGGRRLQERVLALSQRAEELVGGLRG